MPGPVTRRPASRGAAAALGVALLVALPLAPSVRATGLPRLFEAPWMGFDTGAWGEPFGPRSLAAGDLDGDGDVDVLVGQSYFGSPGVSVLLNLGDGTYGRPSHHPLAFNEVVGRVALSDFDGDGHLDALATMPDANGLSSELLLWLGDGAGGLIGPERQATGPGPVGLALADFDRDGHDDVVTADNGFNGQGTTVSLLRHDGDTGPAAGFLPPVSFTVGTGPLSVAAGDLDGDGWPDLAVARSATGAPVVTLLFNDRAGGFGPPTDLPSGARGAPVVALGDLDDDGDLDVVTGWLDNSGSVSRGVVRVYRNDGSGGFGTPDDHPLDPFAEDPEDIALGDLDGDGWLDVVTANPNGRSLEGWRLLPSRGGGALDPPRVHACSQNTEALVIANVDGDCDDDVVTVARFSSALTVHRNPGDGVFPAPTPFPVAGFAREVEAADVDGDGDVDLVLAESGVEIFTNDGTGGFGARETWLAPGSATSAKLRDLDGDGDVDLLVNGVPGGGFAVGRNDGAGHFGAPEVWSIDPCGGDRVDAFDLDGDGDLDVAMSGCAQGAERYLLVAENDGTGRFAAAPHVPSLVATRGLAAARVDGDATVDLVAIESGFGLATYPGNGALGFGPGVISSAPPYLFALHDFDGDGLVDAAVTIPADSFGTDLVGIARGRGDGTFDDPALVAASSVLEPLRVSNDLDVADVDCDGAADVVVTSYASNDLGVFVSNGDGTLQPQVRYGANLTPSASAAADVTGDGRLDLVTTSQVVGPPGVGRSLVVLPGTCGDPTAGGGQTGLPPEIDPRSLRVRKAGPAARDVEVSFATGRLRRPAEDVEVLRGTIASLADAATYDHGALPGGCGLDASPFVDPGAADPSTPGWYYLAVRRCAVTAPPLEGPYGNAYDGWTAWPRPDALTASGDACP